MAPRDLPPDPHATHAPFPHPLSPEASASQNRKPKPSENFRLKCSQNQTGCKSCKGKAAASPSLPTPPRPRPEHECHTREPRLGEGAGLDGWPVPLGASSWGCNSHEIHSPGHIQSPRARGQGPAAAQGREGKCSAVKLHAAQRSSH